MTLVALAVVLVAVGAALLVAPGWADAAWPWPLTPLTARAVGAWCVGLAVAAGHARLVDDAPSLGPVGVTGVLFGVLQTIALVRHGSELDWSSQAGAGTSWSSPRSRRWGPGSSGRPGGSRASRLRVRLVARSGRTTRLAAHTSRSRRGASRMHVARSGSRSCRVWTAWNPARASTPGSRVQRPATTTVGTPCACAARRTPIGALPPRGLLVENPRRDHQARVGEEVLEPDEVEDDVDPGPRGGPQCPEGGEAHPACCPGARVVRGWP